MKKKLSYAPSERLLPHCVYEINIVCGGAAATTPKQHRHVAQWDTLNLLFMSIWNLVCGWTFKTSYLRQKNALNDKGQLISKYFFGVIVWTKIVTKILSRFPPWNFLQPPGGFLEALGASWKLFGLPGDLVSNIINKEAYRNPKKLPGSSREATKKFRAEILTIFLFLFWSKL